MPTPENELATPCFPACPYNYSAIGTVNDMLLIFFYNTLLRDDTTRTMCCVQQIYRKNIYEHCFFYSFVIDTNFKNTK